MIEPVNIADLRGHVQQKRHEWEEAVAAVDRVRQELMEAQAELQRAEKAHEALRIDTMIETNRLRRSGSLPEYAGETPEPMAQRAQADQEVLSRNEQKETV